MPSRIGVLEASRFLRTRDELVADGHSDRDIRRLVEDEDLVRVRRNRYVDALTWNRLWNEGRHLLQVVATHLNCDPPGPVFCGPSAAVLHGLPLYRHAPEKVHAVIMGRRHGRSRAGLMWHFVDAAAGDIVEIDGFRCTSLERTALDLATALRPEAGLSAVDAALRSVAVSGHVQDEDAAQRWRADLLQHAASRHDRGIRRAREIIDLADGRAQLPGESVSRWRMHQLGYRDVLLQVHIPCPGEEFWMDFGFPRARCFGEFDGEGKYVDPALTSGRSTSEIVLAEKRREDLVRGVTGWRTARWGHEHIRTPDALAARLAAFRIPPPG
ncbi:hypothetical protein ACIPV2_03915 [Microbacterium sp. NPDC089987]|uniref:type IV toxin-antitoxin system AbiEi family antitoxin domain-containing protein n=1 Tax=Microbacterium sp. NPDC089987 TaxID=3364202 RepID=UPI00382F3452